MVAPLHKSKMTPEDRLGYLQNELEQLNIKQRRYRSDRVRPKEDLDWYIKCNEHYIIKVKEEISELSRSIGV